MRGTVLLVEDEPDIADITARTLRRLGYRVAGSARTGEEAIRAAQTNPPSLVLMDIMLPGTMDGIETARRLTASFDIPVIFLTAAQDAPTLERAKTLAPYGYVVKPFEPKRLQIAIDMALSRYEAGERRLEQVQKQTEDRLRAEFEQTVAAIVQPRNNDAVQQTNNPPLLRIAEESNSLDTQLPPMKLKLDAYQKDGSTVWVSGKLRITRKAPDEILLQGGKLAHSGLSA